MRTRPAQVVALAATAAALLAASVQAQPVIRVEAQTRIELSAGRTERGTQLRLVLLDDQGAPVANAALAVRIADSVGQPLWTRPRALTATDGVVEIALPRIEERISVEAHYAGDAFHAGTDAMQLLDTRLARVELKFTAPASTTIDLREPTLSVRIRARTEGTAAGLRIELLDESGNQLGARETDDEGVVALTVQRDQLGLPGAGKLIARAQGDVAHSAALVELPIVRWLPSQISLALSSQRANRVRASGTVRVGAQAIAGAPVGLFGPGGNHVATLRADDQGRYSGDLDRRALGERAGRSLELEARFESDAPWIGSSRSPMITLRLPAAPSYSFFWLALTPALIAAALWWLGRRRPALEPEITANEGAQAGVALAHIKPRAARPQGISCLVLDARTGRALPGARLEITHADGSLTLAHGDARGAIRIEAMAPGSYQLQFGAPGYRALSARLEAPHRGEWIGAHVRLESLRDVAIRAWSPLAQRVAGAPEQAVAITVREAIQRAAPRQDAAHFRLASEALQRAEQAAYAPGAPSDEDVVRVENDASELLQTSSPRRE